MSALSKATRKESDAYQAMTDASADVVARVLEGIDDDVTDRLRRRAQSLRKEWQAAALRDTLRGATAGASSAGRIADSSAMSE